ncbi:MAG: hypothetical protein ACI4UH_01250 [Dorea sp.]
MKQLKKLLLMGMCMCVVLGATACGNNNADDNGATQNGTVNDTNDNVYDGTNNTVDDNMNGATDGTNTNNGKDVMDEIGDDVRDGADNVVDDVTGNNASENKNVNDTNNNVNR